MAEVLWAFQRRTVKRSSAFKAIVFCVIWFCASSIHAQWKEVWQHESGAAFLRMDHLGNVYAVGETEIVKHGPNGEVAYRYSNNRYGAIGDLDVTQPLRPLVYFPQLGTMVLLDNTLSEYRGPIDLTTKGVNYPGPVCSSVQNHFWIFEEGGTRLLRVSDRFDKVVETGNLSQILNRRLNPNFIREFGERVYLNDPREGIFVFDLYGSYIKTIPITGLTGFFMSDHRLSYFRGDTLFRYDTRLHVEEHSVLPHSCKGGAVRFPTAAALCLGRIYAWRRIER